MIEIAGGGCLVSVTDGGEGTPFATFERVSIDAAVHVVVQGELDIATAPELKEQCLAALRTQPSELVIDLGGVTFCDSSALHTLLFIRVEGEALGVPVAVGECSKQAGRILELSGLTEYLQGTGSNGGSGLSGTDG